MEIEIRFPGGAQVDASFGGFTIQTDQPSVGGGSGSAPTPFAHFLASIGTCAGIYVRNFCAQRSIPMDGISLSQKIRTDQPSGMVNHIELDIQLPPDFPERYKAPLARAVELCTVKKHLETPPSFGVRTETSIPV